jgi:hypothetical protein
MFQNLIAVAWEIATQVFLDEFGTLYAAVARLAGSAAVGSTPPLLRREVICST